MKKIFILIISLFLLIAFNACQEITNDITTENQITTEEITTINETTILKQLQTPSNVSINNNIITFDLVENASKYRIAVYDELDNLIGEYNIINGFNLSLLVQVGNYTYTLKATASNYLDSIPTEKQAFSIIDASRINTLEGTQMNNSNYIRWLGRTYYNETDSLKYFYFTASGFELAFFGTSVQITIKANKSNIIGKEAYLVLFIDGEENPNNGTTYIMNQPEKTISVSGLTEGYHTIKLLKRSEASDSNTALKNVTTDGYFTSPPLPKAFKIQYIAASSSTGFGNLGSLSEDKKTSNSDGLHAFAYLTSYLLDADTSIFSASGWGVSRGWNTGGSISETQNIPSAYMNTAIDDSNTVFTSGTFDFTEYIPDVVLVNLGTNDFNASGYSSMSELEKQAIETRFINDYVDFLVRLNNLYPNAKIIVAYGLMNEAGTLGNITLEVINQANTQIGSNVVYDFLMEGAGSNGNPFGCSYHPNVQTSMNVAEALAELIHQITGREIVRDMIAYE